MESEPLNNPPAQPDEFEQRLRAHLALPPLADDGFSARVARALPPVTRRSSATRRRWLIAAGGGLGLLAALVFGGDFAPAAAWREITAPLHVADPSWWSAESTTPWLVGTALACAWWAFRDEVSALFDF